MKIDILTIFPEMFVGPFDESIVKRARENGSVEINIHDLRKWSTDRYQTVDDRPYGGGPGMVFMVQPIYDALESLKSEIRSTKFEINSKSQISNLKQIQKSKLEKIRSRVILLSPQGAVFTQQKALELSQLKHIILIAGHYEGVDERVREHLVDEEISIGDYVLTGGELPAMVVVDAVVRLLPKVLGDKTSLEEESFSPKKKQHGKVLLEYPQYTRPEVFKEWRVPEVLLSGNHEEISKWRKLQALERTIKRRPDLLEKSS